LILSSVEKLLSFIQTQQCKRKAGSSGWEWLPNRNVNNGFTNFLQTSLSDWGTRGFSLIPTANHVLAMIITPEMVVRLSWGNVFRNTFSSPEVNLWFGSDYILPWIYHPRFGVKQHYLCEFRVSTEPVDFNRYDENDVSTFDWFPMTAPPTVTDTGIVGPYDVYRMTFFDFRACLLHLPL